MTFTDHITDDSSGDDSGSDEHGKGNNTHEVNIFIILIHLRPMTDVDMGVSTDLPSFAAMTKKRGSGKKVQQVRQQKTGVSADSSPVKNAAKAANGRSKVYDKTSFGMQAARHDTDMHRSFIG